MCVCIYKKESVAVCIIHVWVCIKRERWSFRRFGFLLCPYVRPPFVLFSIGVLGCPSVATVSFGVKRRRGDHLTNSWNSGLQWRKEFNKTHENFCKLSTNCLTWRNSSFIFFLLPLFFYIFPSPNICILYLFPCLNRFRTRFLGGESVGLIMAYGWFLGETKFHKLIIKRDDLDTTCHLLTLHAWETANYVIQK